MRFSVSLTVLLLAASTVAAVAGQDIFRWTDEDGQVHYGSRPPGDQATRVLTQPPPPTVSEPNEQARAQARQRMLDAFDRDRQLRQQQAREEAAEARENAQRCRKLTRHWRRLHHPGPIYFGNDTQGRRYLDDAERKAEQDKLRGPLKSACGEIPSP